MVELLPSNNFPITLPLHSTPLHSVHKKSQRPLLRALDCCQRQPATRGGGEEGRSEGAFPNCAVSFLQHVHRSDSDRPTDRQQLQGARAGERRRHVRVRPVHFNSVSTLQPSIKYTTTSCTCIVQEGPIKPCLVNSMACHVNVIGNAKSQWDL